MTYFHESEEKRVMQRKRDEEDAKSNVEHEPHPTMPQVFGPENRPPKAPPLPSFEVVRGEMKNEIPNPKRSG